MTASTERYAVIADRFARGVLRHWLFFVNTTLVVFASLPWLSPILRNAGWDRAGRFIAMLYARMCHQFPDRAFYIGQYQVCYCHRCTALYSSIALVGLSYGLLRWRWTLSNRLLLWAAVPILIDGLWHMAADFLPTYGLRSTYNDVGSLNFWVRLATGTLFGVAVVLWTLPRLQEEFAKI